ncbi:hypothetical protein D3C80_1911010 [compost metagenome]
MRGKKNQIARVGFFRHLVEALERVDLPVPERVFGLVIGLGENERKVRFAQDRCAEHLVAGGDTLFGQGQGVPLDHVQQPFGQFGLCHVFVLRRMCCRI